MLSEPTMIQQLKQLSTLPRHQEEEYEYTSDFLEWAYQYVYREQGHNLYPVLHLISKDAKYNTLVELCKNLINCNYAKNLDEETLLEQHNTLKELTLELLEKYNESL